MCVCVCISGRHLAPPVPVWSRHREEELTREVFEHVALTDNGQGPMTELVKHWKRNGIYTRHLLKSQAAMLLAIPSGCFKPVRLI